jgi:hypothetical protein
MTNNETEGVPMTDQKLATAIDAAIKELNKALYDAAFRGLRVEIDTLELNRMELIEPANVLKATIYRPINPDLGSANQKENL